jgi:hypothetical protein
VNGDEQVRVGAVGDRCTLFERKVSVVLTGVDHLCTCNIFFDQLAQTQRHIKAEVLLEQTVQPPRARVVPPVAGINRDAVNLQPQFPRQGKLAFVAGACFQRDGHCRLPDERTQPRLVQIEIDAVGRSNLRRVILDHIVL